jgi:hypothetical protein
MSSVTIRRRAVPRAQGDAGGKRRTRAGVASLLWLAIRGLSAAEQSTVTAFVVRIGGTTPRGAGTAMDHEQA